jgi:cytochrome c55X
MQGSVRHIQAQLNKGVRLLVLSVAVLFGSILQLSAQTPDASVSAIVVHEIIIQKMRFIPEHLTIHEGDSVRWVNREKRQYHNVWFESLGEEEPDYLFPEDSYQRHFYQQGEYPYRCGPHPLMLGRITVLPRKQSEAANSIEAATTGEETLTQARQDELLYLLKQDCGSCHGMRLLGGLGPALLPENLAAASVEDLTAIILHGRPGTAMPPWKALLTEADARWLSHLLKAGAVKTGVVKTKGALE